MQKGLGRDKGFKFWVFWLSSSASVSSETFSPCRTSPFLRLLTRPSASPVLAISLVYVALTYLATVREIPWLGKVASIVVPHVPLFYLAGGIVIILMNIANLPASLALIVKKRFYRYRRFGRFYGRQRGSGHPYRLRPRDVLQ